MIRYPGTCRKFSSPIFFSLIYVSQARCWKSQQLNNSKGCTQTNKQNKTKKQSPSPQSLLSTRDQEMAT